MGKITVVGLGPGRFGLITLESWQLIEQAGTLLLRTRIHPTVEALTARGLKFATYDDFYERADDFPTLYQAIAQDLLQRARRGQDIVYAVPGSPLVAEHTVTILRGLTETAGIPLTIMPGMSFLEILCTRLKLDPIDGLTIIDAGEIAAMAPGFRQGTVISQVYDQRVASDVKLYLMEQLPDEYEIVYAHHLALPDEDVRRLPLFELDRQARIDHLTSLFVPAKP